MHAVRLASCRNRFSNGAAALAVEHSPKFVASRFKSWHIRSLDTREGARLAYSRIADRTALGRGDDAEDDAQRGARTNRRPPKLRRKSPASSSRALDSRVVVAARRLT